MISDHFGQEKKTQTNMEMHQSRAELLLFFFYFFCCYFFSRYKCILVFWVIVITDSTGLIWNTELCQHRLVDFDSNTWNQTSMAPCSSVLICLCVPVSLDTYLERSDMCVCLLSVWKKTEKVCVCVQGHCSISDSGCCRYPSILSARSID